MPEVSTPVTKDPDDSLHAQKQCLTTNLPGEPLAPMINQSTNQKQRNRRVFFSNDVKRSIIENLEANIENFDAGELLQDLDKLTSKLLLRKLSRRIFFFQLDDTHAQRTWTLKDVLHLGEFITKSVLCVLHVNKTWEKDSSLMAKSQVVKTASKICTVQSVEYVINQCHQKVL
jgi:hypothetical protein